MAGRSMATFTEPATAASCWLTAAVSKKAVGRSRRVRWRTPDFARWPLTCAVSGSSQVFFRSRIRRIESRRQFVESGRGAIPSQLLQIVEKRDVGPQRRQCAEQQRVVPLPRERLSEAARAGGVHVPLAPVRG